MRTTVTIMLCLERYAPTIWSLTDTFLLSTSDGRLALVGGQPFLGVKGLPGLFG